MPNLDRMIVDELWINNVGERVFNLMVNDPWRLQRENEAMAREKAQPKPILDTPYEDIEF